MSGSLLLRLLGVAAFTAAPVAALDTNPTPEIRTGDAIGSPEEGGFQNTGGNFNLGDGKSESKTVLGDPNAAPAAPSILAVPPVALPKNPGADAVARARALVDAAKARAQTQVDAARAAADRAVAAAHQQTEEAKANAQAHSDAARANAAAASARSNP